MKEKIDSVKFNLTDIMTEELIKFNNIKKELLNLKNKEILNNNDIKRIKQLENKLNEIRINFIKEFRKNNKDEIIEYMKYKDEL